MLPVAVVTGSATASSLPAATAKLVAVAKSPAINKGSGRKRKEALNACVVMVNLFLKRISYLIDGGQQDGDIRRALVLANWLFLKMDTRHVLPASGGQADDAACIISAVITGRSLLTCMGQAV